MKLFFRFLVTYILCLAVTNAATIIVRGPVLAPAAGGGGTVTLDAVATNQVMGGSVSTLTTSFTMGSVTDGCLIVRCCVGDANATTISSCTYAGTGMTLIGSVQVVGGSGNGHLAAFRLTAGQGLAAGTANIVVTLNQALTGGGSVIIMTADSWANVDQTTPIDNVAQTNGNDTNPSRTVTSATNSRAMACTNAGSDYTSVATTTRSTATQHNYSVANGGGCFASSDRAGSASETFTYTISGTDSWANIGFNLRHN